MYHSKVDLGQSTYTKLLRDMGISVALTHTVRNGFPDCVLGVGGHNVLVEWKTKEEPLTDKEKKWHDNWKGQVLVARRIQDVLEYLSQRNLWKPGDSS